jgi:DNA modification methylase
MIGPVLDPFAGSGTVLKVDGEMKMDSVGIELNKSYCVAMAEELLARSVVADIKTLPWT